MAVAADIAARGRAVLVAAPHTVWLRDPAAAAAAAAAAADADGAAAVLLASRDAPALRSQRLDASLLFARPSAAARRAQLVHVLAPIRCLARSQEPC